MSGALKGGESAVYVLRALAGQSMSVSVLSPGNDALLTVTGVSDGVPYLRLAERATEWQGVLPRTQDYRLQVVAVGGDTPFAMEVVIPPLPTPIPTPTRIQFEPGAVSATRQGFVAAHGIAEYVVWAQAGQVMTVTLTSPRNDVFLTIVGADGIPYLRYVTGQTNWHMELPATQDYVLRAVSVGDEGSDFTLQVRISPLSP
ncbi:MAG: hypothetical protein D6796_01320 [Caldilineae bacterium]|nr:MAG: hypothetical protein D6796_01320 [Caldilineae bacterium]